MNQAQIKRLRKDSGLTLEKFAKAVGTSIQSIVNWEQGIYKPNKAGIAKLEKYINKKGKVLKTPKKDKVTKSKHVKKAKKKK